MNVTFKLREVDDSFPDVTNEGEVEIEQGHLCLMIAVKGYGEACSGDGDGHPILLERYQGQLRLVVWGDINQEDPTHIISLEDAREDRRLAEDSNFLTQHEVDEYVKAGGVRCINKECKSEDLHCEQGHQTDHNGNLYQNITCGECGWTWTDDFKLGGVSGVEKPTDVNCPGCGGPRHKCICPPEEKEQE